jgi:hypothetical protein
MHSASTARQPSRDDVTTKTGRWRLYPIRVISFRLRIEYYICEICLLPATIDRDRPNGQMFLSQKAYVERLVEKFELTAYWIMCNRCYTPSSMEVMTKPDETCDLQNPYGETTESLMYLMLCTRPDSFGLCCKILWYLRPVTLDCREANHPIFEYN